MRTQATDKDTVTSAKTPVYPRSLELHRVLAALDPSFTSPLLNAKAQVTSARTHSHKARPTIACARAR